MIEYITWFDVPPKPKASLMMSITREEWKSCCPQQTNPNCKSAALPDWGSRGGGVQPEVQQQIRAIVPQISGYFTRCHAGSYALGRHYSFVLSTSVPACNLNVWLGSEWWKYDFLKIHFSSSFLQEGNLLWFIISWKILHLEPEKIAKNVDFWTMENYFFFV